MSYYIGVDLGGTNIAVGLVAQDGKLIHKISAPTNAAAGFENLVKRIARLCDEVADAGHLCMGGVESIGIGVPGAVDNKTGRVVLAVNLDWADLPLAEELQRYINKPVYLGNDADCAALGEVVAGCAAGYDSAVMITLGTGVGSGVVMDKRIFCGCTGGGTEAGHIPIVLGGEVCGCGKHGCYEAYASATALIRQTKNAMDKYPESLMHIVAEEKGKIDGRTAFEAMHRGDTVAAGVVDKYTDYVAAGIGAVINMLRPEIIILGGGICNAGAALLDPVNEKIPNYVYGAGLLEVPKVVKATLGNDAGIIGAALLGKE